MGTFGSVLILLIIALFILDQKWWAGFLLFILVLAALV